MDCVAALPVLASNRVAANEVGAIEFAASLRYRCLLQMDYLQQMKWVLLNLLIRCVAALPLLASNGLPATNEVGAIEFDVSLLLRYRC
jgi:hypothetical protein